MAYLLIIEHFYPIIKLHNYTVILIFKISACYTVYTVFFNVL